MTVWGRRTGRTYLVDCSADFCVLPASGNDKRKRPQTDPLMAANGSLIKTWGKRKVSLLLGQGRSFIHEFHVRKDGATGHNLLLQLSLGLSTTHHVDAPLTKRPPPDRRFGSIHVDIVGPLPASEGITYLFKIVDRFTHWPEAIPIEDSLAVSCARALICHWVARFGVPDDHTEVWTTRSVWQQRS